MTQTKAAFNQINGNVVSVLDYGAVGDDTTDNTSAIQSSVIYAANNGKTLYIPKGIYKINGTITIPAIGLKIVGDGVENSIIRQTSTTLDALKTDPSITRNYSGLLQDFSIFMPDNATGTAIEINNPNGRYEINRVNIDMESGERSDGTGIRIYRTSGAALVDGYFTTIRNCFINKYNKGVVIEGQNPGGAIVHWIDQTSVTDCTTYGIHLINTSGVKVKYCHIEVNKTGIYTENTSDLQLERNYFERSNDYDWHHASGDACVASFNRFAASAIGLASGRAVYIDTTNFSSIVNNYFLEGFTSFDIELLAGCNGVFIADNITKVVAGWGSDGPRVSDAGTATFLKNPQLTTGGTYQYNMSSGRYICNDMNMTAPTILGGSNNAQVIAGNGSPEGSVTASRGAVYLRTDGGNGFTFYIKETGDATSTGWRANNTFNDMKLIDGITAPGTESGVARLYVDTADGDLKVKFGDGTVKTIVTDT